MPKTRRGNKVRTARKGVPRRTRRSKHPNRSRGVFRRTRRAKHPNRPRGVFRRTRRASRRRPRVRKTHRATRRGGLAKKFNREQDGGMLFEKRRLKKINDTEVSYFFKLNNGETGVKVKRKVLKNAKEKKKFKEQVLEPIKMIYYRSDNNWDKIKKGVLEAFQEIRERLIKDLEQYKRESKDGKDFLPRGLSNELFRIRKDYNSHWTIYNRDGEPTINEEYYKIVKIILQGSVFTADGRDLMSENHLIQYFDDESLQGEINSLMVEVRKHTEEIVCDVLPGPVRSKDFEDAREVHCRMSKSAILKKEILSIKPKKTRNNVIEVLENYVTIKSEIDSLVKQYGYTDWQEFKTDKLKDDLTFKDIYEGFVDLCAIYSVQVDAFVEEVKKIVDGKGKLYDHVNKVKNFLRKNIIIEPLFERGKRPAPSSRHDVPFDDLRADLLGDRPGPSSRRGVSYDKKMMNKNKEMNKTIDKVYENIDVEPSKKIKKKLENYIEERLKSPEYIKKQLSPEKTISLVEREILNGMKNTKMYLKTHPYNYKEKDIQMERVLDYYISTTLIPVDLAKMYHDNSA